MAKNDIVVWNSPHGGHDRVTRGYIDASETFENGEPVRFTTAGTIAESPDEPLSTEICGIAVTSGNTAVTDRSFFNPATGAAYATNDDVSFLVPSPHTYFATRNFATGGAGVPVAPAQTNIYDIASLVLTVGGSWYLDVGGAAGALICQVIDVYNLQKESIVRTGETLTAPAQDVHGDFWVVFQIVMHQSMPNAGLAVLPLVP